MDVMSRVREGRFRVKYSVCGRRRFGRIHSFRPDERGFGTEDLGDRSPPDNEIRQTCEQMEIMSYHRIN